MYSYLLLKYIYQKEYTNNTFTLTRKVSLRLTWNNTPKVAILNSVADRNCFQNFCKCWIILGRVLIKWKTVIEDDQIETGNDILHTVRNSRRYSSFLDLMNTVYDIQIVFFLIFWIQQMSFKFCFGCSEYSRCHLSFLLKFWIHSRCHSSYRLDILDTVDDILFWLLRRGRSSYLLDVLLSDILKMIGYSCCRLDILNRVEEILLRKKTMQTSTTVYIIWE